MSGHSHWATIKHKKGLTDIKRGQMFSKMMTLIEAAARSDPNPNANPSLRVAIERAKKNNIPQDRVEYAIKKAQGLTKDSSLIEEGLVEAVGPNSLAIIIETVTDNKNRTIAGIRNILSRFNGRIAEPGSTLWNFEKKSVIETKTKINEDDSLKLIDSGAEDFLDFGDGTRITGEPQSFQKIIETLKTMNIESDSINIGYVPKNMLQPDSQANIGTILKVLDELENYPDVKNVYINMDLTSPTND